jgi:hypothetical protein
MRGSFGLSSRPFGLHGRTTGSSFNHRLKPTCILFRLGPDCNYHWRGGYGAVVAAWNAMAAHLMTRPAEQLARLGHSLNALGKDRAHWDTLYQQVQVRDLTARLAAQKSATP